MIFENEIFKIYYNECDERCLNKLIDILTIRIPIIIQFFKLNFDGKITIKLYNDIEQYKSKLISSFEKETQKNNIEPRKYQNWMIANTEEGFGKEQQKKLAKVYR
ncbi:MAG: hypothetical protein ACI310_03115 [Bacilli bacterium]